MVGDQEWESIYLGVRIRWYDRVGTSAHHKAAEARKRSQRRPSIMPALRCPAETEGPQRASYVDGGQEIRAALREAATSDCVGCVSGSPSIHLFKTTNQSICLSVQPQNTPARHPMSLPRKCSLRRFSVRPSVLFSLALDQKTYRESRVSSGLTAGGTLTCMCNRAAYVVAVVRDVP